MHYCHTNICVINKDRTSKNCYVSLLIIVLYLCIGIDSIYSQDQLDTLEVDFDVISVDDGLSAGYMSEVMIDANGFLWIPTRQGLNRYDGYKIKEYRHIPGDTSSLKVNKTNRLFMDSRGWLWIATSPGLSLFDFKSETFINFELEVARWIKEDKWNNIWIREYNGDWKTLTIDQSWKGSADFSQMRRYIQINEKTELFNGLPARHNMDAILLSDKHGLMYHKNDTLFAYDLNYLDNSASLKFRKPLKPGFQNHLPCLFEDEERDIVWFVDSENYYSIDSQTGEFLNSHALPSYLQNSNIAIQYIDNKGNLWISSEELKVYSLSPSTGQVSILKKAGVDDQTESTRISGNSFKKDDHNNLWISTTGYGLYKFNLNKKKFKSFSEPPSISKVSFTYLPLKDKTITLPIYSCIDKENLESCLGSGFKYKITAKHNYILTLVDLDVKIYVFLASENMENSDPDSILIFDAQGNRLENFSFEDIGFERIKSITARCFFNNKNNLCHIGCDYESRELTLHQWFDLDSNSMKVYVYPHHGDDLITGEIYKPYVSEDDKIWIPTSSNGIYTWEPKTETWNHFQNDALNPASISSDQVYGFLSDPTFPDSIMWVGTGDGLNKMNLKTNTFEVYKKEDGLPNSVIYGIQSDDYNNLWLSTNYGICRFDPVTTQSVHYNVEDGLLHNEFNKETQLKANNGIVYFGGMGGINYFDPNVFYEKYPSSPIQINGIRVNNESIEYARGSLNQNDAIDLRSPVEYLEEITISHNERMITFEFTLLDFTNPKENEYKYKLEGFNKNWIDAKKSNEATYTNLSPGTYVFQVKGKNANDTWNEIPAKLKLIVLPPYWQTWWFRLLLGSVGIGIFYLIYRNKKRQKEDLENLRNRISQDLHDEIGSTLSSISLFGVVAEKEIDRNGPLARKMLRRIGTNTTSMMESLNDIVWAINSGNDKMIYVIQRMRSFTTELDEVSGWNIDFDYSDDIKELEISMIHRRNIYLIFKEAVNNAIKYSKGENLHIRLENKGSNIRMEIVDDGKGFDKEQIKVERSMGGNGLINMERRADELGGQLIIDSNEGGTRVYLTFNINQTLKSL